MRWEVGGVKRGKVIEGRGRCNRQHHVPYTTGGGVNASLTGSTMGSVVVRYGISLPAPEQRGTSLNHYFAASKDYSLVHAAPVVGVFILDHEGVPIPTPNEVTHKVAPGGMCDEGKGVFVLLVVVRGEIGCTCVWLWVCGRDIMHLQNLFHYHLSST